MAAEPFRIPFHADLDGVLESGVSVEEKLDFCRTRGIPAAIDQVSWRAFPGEGVAAEAAILHGSRYIALAFSVSEPEIRAEVLEDQGPVYQDSCVEWFVSAGQGYWNFEANPRGVCLHYYGSDRNNRQPASPESMRSILRFPARAEVGSWKLLFGIPKSLFPAASFDADSGCTWSCNFYKCGDRLKNPHYLSWNRILTAAPDFHRPEFFRSIEFASQM